MSVSLALSASKRVLTPKLFRVSSRLSQLKSVSNFGRTNSTSDRGDWFREIQFLKKFAPNNSVTTLIENILIFHYIVLNKWCNQLAKALFHYYFKSISRP